MKLLTLAVTLVCTIFLAGCSHRTESKKEYYEQVETLPYESIEVFRHSNTPIKIAEYIENGKPGIQFAHAEVLEDNSTLKISTYAVRLGKVIIARGDYFYNEVDGKLILTNYVASQTSLIGDFRIPTLDGNDIKQLASSGKKDSANWLSFNKNANTFAIQYASKTLNSQGIVTLLGISANVGSAYGLTDSFTDNTAPTVAIYTKPQNCADTQLNLRPQQIPVFLNNVPFRAVATCIPAEMAQEKTPIAQYALTPRMVSILVENESKNKPMYMQINNQEFDLNLSGFSYALNKVRASAK